MDHEAHRKLDRLLENQGVITRNQQVIVRWLESLWNKENAIMSNVTQAQVDLQNAFTAEIAKQTTVTQGAIALISTLKQQVADAMAHAQATQPSFDPAPFQAMLDRISANDTAMANAVAQNTVAASEVPAVAPAPSPATPAAAPPATTP